MDEITQQAFNDATDDSRPRYSAREMQEFMLKHEKWFPDAEGLESEYEFKLTAEDQMKIDAQLDKVDGEFYMEPLLHEQKREDNYK